MNATLGRKNIHKSLNSNQMEGGESIKQIEIAPEMTTDVRETCENMSYLAESIEDCRSEVDRNKNNYYEKINVLAECSECEIISKVENEQNNERLHSIEKVQECEIIKQYAEPTDIDQSRLDESKRSTINFFCKNLDELKDNFQS